MYEYTYSYDEDEKCGGRGDKYLDFLEHTVLPLVSSQYRVQTRSLGIMGSSLGGLISCYAAATRPSVFNKAGCLSSSFFWNKEDFHNVIMPKYVNKSTPRQYCQSYYIDSGDSGAEDSHDCWYESSTVATDYILSGFTLGRNMHHYLDVGGQHSESYWGARLHIPMSLLYHAHISYDCI